METATHSDFSHVDATDTATFFKESLYSSAHLSVS